MDGACQVGIGWVRWRNNNDDPEPIVWYRVPKSNGFFPGVHRFGLASQIDHRDYKDVPDGVAGEFPLRWMGQYNPLVPVLKLRPGVCGPMDWWRDGAPDGAPSLEWVEGGFSTCCEGLVGMGTQYTIPRFGAGGMTVVDSRIVDNGIDCVTVSACVDATLYYQDGVSIAQIYDTPAQRNAAINNALVGYASMAEVDSAIDAALVPYLTSADAAATYETIAYATANYETITHASATYETITHASATYETTSHASATYETKTHASATYETTAHASATYETASHASSTYQTITGAAASYQPLDSDLTALAAFASTGLAVRTGPGTWAPRFLSPTAGKWYFLQADGSGGNPQLAIADMQPSGPGATGGLVPDGPGVVYGANLAPVLDLNATWRVPSGRLIGVPSAVPAIENCTSATPQDLATIQQVGPFTLVGPPSQFLIQANATARNETAVAANAVIYANVDGTTTRIAGCQLRASLNDLACCAGFLPISLSAGSHTIKLQFATGGGTISFQSRTIVVTVLG